MKRFFPTRQPLVRLATLSVLAILALGGPASAQDQEVLADPTAQPPGPPRELILSDAAIDRRACKRDVVVDDVPLKWDPLEKGVDAAWEAYTAGDFAKSVPLFKKLADIGHPVAQRLMGVVYYFGQGVPVDFRMSLFYFESAANQGCFSAYAPTAQLYDRGEGALPDPGRAYAWYNIAVAHLPQSKERTDMIDLREAVAAQLTPAQLEAAQKRSLAFKPKPVAPPDIGDLPEDFFKQP
ncbi:Sel1 repeat-containing protein [Dongia mobilis]|uniref:Sel1 repeat-containing protein n=1 Tax=Dongia mobilis TaxID=578943 RepID=A0A4R6WQP1_9PROT|nr:tetratricopeptide repeat protein [Dongia mobilis]TDQ78862.1 Sel1 repeat-containing protein [Dongia mobilis]